ncbi:hypothetical protein sS8_2828 [Methylocaldum marinum]|uniref:Uncharacterized protein n=1 Tax=Methylocaldum marinum TaxID=1432792 RepID=A0A250KSW2_9GAMM|nr:hypothetical protein sS8_2828 [Methylocaldum marinum]
MGGVDHADGEAVVDPEQGQALTIAAGGLQTYVGGVGKACSQARNALTGRLQAAGRRWVEVLRPPWATVVEYDGEAITVPDSLRQDTDQAFAAIPKTYRSARSALRVCPRNGVGRNPVKCRMF